MPSVERSPVRLPVPVEILGVEQEEVIEGVRGKVKGLEQRIQTESMLLKAFERWSLELMRKLILPWVLQ